jgi:hypothetical protein
MKCLLTLFLLLITLKLCAQSGGLNDSVNVRVFNQGRFYLKKYTITVGSRKYVFSDIFKHKYSAFQKLPYLYSENQTEICIVRKRLLNYDDWENLLEIPIDHIGGRKFTAGNVTINVFTKRKSGKLIVISKIEPL